MRQSAPEIRMPAGLSSAVAEVWDALGLDEHVLEDPRRQRDYQHAVVRDVGRAWTELVSRASEDLASRPYVAVVRGGDVRWARRLLSAFAAAFGRMTNPYRGIPGTGLLMEIVAKGPASPDQVWLWHTDSVNWPVPNDFSAFVCTAAAPSGGATQILSLDALRASEGWRDDLFVPLWEEEYAWPIERALGGGTVKRCPLTGERLSFRRELMLIDRSASREFRVAVEEFAALADDVGPEASVRLEPGDLLIFDNRRVMHRSGPVVDPEVRRRLVRTKVISHG